MRSVRSTILLLVILVVALPAAWADVPQNINVQGRLTDGAGDPVAPGLKIFTFRIFDAEVGGTKVWPGGTGEEQTLTTDANGLWNAQVGALEAIHLTVFNDTTRWLEITVDDGVNPAETLPRIKLNTNPWAFQTAFSEAANLALSADFATIANEAQNALELDGVPASNYTQVGHGHAPADISPQGAGSNLDADQLDGQHGSFYQNASNLNNGTVHTDHYSGYADLTAEGYLDNNASTDLLTRVQSDARYVDFAGDVMTGSIDMITGQYRNSWSHTNDQEPNVDAQTENGTYTMSVLNSTRAVLGVATSDGAESKYGVTGMAAGANGDIYGVTGWVTGSSPIRYSGLFSGGDFVVTAPASSGSQAVQLPAFSIDAFEIGDEPGLVANRYSSSVTLTQGGSMTDLTTCQIATPSSGYIVVRGRTTIQTSGTVGRNQAYVQIDETSGGSQTAPYYTQAGIGAHVNVGSFNYYPTSCERIYQRSAGTYTFRLEAQAHGSNGAGASTRALYAFITAVYYPTSYGSVTTVASAADAAEFPTSKTLVVSEPIPDVVDQGGEFYRVDLRELELKLVKAERETERARRELIEAQFKADMEIRVNGVPQENFDE